MEHILKECGVKAEVMASPWGEPDDIVSYFHVDSCPLLLKVCSAAYAGRISLAC
jgi:hypothetical protein